VTAARHAGRGTRLRGVAPALLLAAAAALAACRSEPQTPSLRQWTEDLAFQITSEPMPPHARERTLFKVIVRDKKSRRPIEVGEGQIYASSRDGKNIFDALDKGPELGTYYGTLNFITSGTWAVAIRFRRDSTGKIQTINWMQDVLAERPDVVP
jgi:hypothetical protein